MTRKKKPVAIIVGENKDDVRTLLGLASLRLFPYEFASAEQNPQKHLTNVLASCSYK